MYLPGRCTGRVLCKPAHVRDQALTRPAEAPGEATGTPPQATVLALTQLLSRYTARKPASEVTLTFVTRIREVLAADVVVLRSYSRTDGTRSVVAGDEPGTRQRASKVDQAVRGAGVRVVPGA